MVFCPVTSKNSSSIAACIFGNGRGDKKQIMTMIPKLVALPEGKVAQDDEYDAIAIGITAFAYSHISRETGKLSP
jgi:Holliday junction resolvasome RuvABC endonuclease subunit